MKKVLAILVSVLLLATMLPMGVVSVGASNNIVINGVDIGYAIGDYFTKDGESCATSAFSNGTCHGHGICINSTDSRCNCMRYWPTGVKSTCQIDLAATQCFGFARYCQWKVYGYHDGNNSSKFTNLTGKISASNCTAATLKAKLLGCAPATHIRTGDDGHSIVVTGTDSERVYLVACNMPENGVKTCKIYSKAWTWAEFATYLQGRNGVAYAKAVSGASSGTSSGSSYSSTNPDDYTFPTRSLYYTTPTMTGSDVAWVQAVLNKLGFSVAIDGKYGPATRDIIKQFQTKYGLEADGKCGPITRAKLQELWNAKKCTHTYSNACDATCNKCGATRTPSAHVYSNTCDTTCNTCGATRSITHSYSAATCTKPETCTVCGHTQGSALGHTYDHACDTICNTCGATRSITHSYSAATCTTPKTCSVCGATSGSALGHKYDDDYDADCNVCGEEREVDLPADAPAFVVERTSAREGQEFTVAIRTLRNSGIVSLKLNVTYDAAVLELVEAVEMDFDGASFGPLAATPFVVNWVDALRPDNTTDGVVALLTFRVKEGAPIGKTDITLSYDPADVFDQNYDNVAFRTENGVVEIVDYMLGDATGDGAVNNRDLAMMQQYINGWKVVVDADACDVNVDGAINNRDLALLQQYINGWDVTLGKK